jgi:hypothetical protein
MMDSFLVIWNEKTKEFKVCRFLYDRITICQTQIVNSFILPILIFKKKKFDEFTSYIS